MELFRLKFSALSPADIKEFLEVYRMDYKPLTEDQKIEVSDCLYVSYAGKGVSKSVSAMDFYKVNFLEVLDLVRLRKCYLNGGYAYVNTLDFVSIIGSKHQGFIEKGLQVAKNLSSCFFNHYITFVSVPLNDSTGDSRR